MRVLLAEDNPINALLATRALERLGAEVVHAVDGVEALDSWTSDGPFDLALIDVRMPRLDGHETARRIRAAEIARVRPAPPRGAHRQCRPRGRDRRTRGRLRRFPGQAPQPEAASGPAGTADRPGGLNAAALTDGRVPRHRTPMSTSPTRRPHPRSSSGALAAWGDRALVVATVLIGALAPARHPAPVRSVCRGSGLP